MWVSLSVSLSLCLCLCLSFSLCLCLLSTNLTVVVVVVFFVFYVFLFLLSLSFSLGNLLYLSVDISIHWSINVTCHRCLRVSAANSAQSRTDLVPSPHSFPAFTSCLHLNESAMVIKHYLHNCWRHWKLYKQKDKKDRQTFMSNPLILCDKVRITKN
jgi:ABC-type transport system involved in multi-copper enzyme maturation permease subunit